MKKITVNGCHNCPFMNSEYDDFAIGFSNIDTCLLSKFLNLDNYIISVYNLDEQMSNFRIEPIWCPLKINETTVNFEEYDVETKNKINELSLETLKIEETLEIISSEDNEIEYQKLEDKLSDLYKELKKLLENK
jgi:hypothetical protein